MNFISALDDARNITPIIISGAARSGTRMITDILNTHKNIAIQEEMHAKTIEAFFSMIKTTNETFKSYSLRKGKELDHHWNKFKPALIHSFFVCANKREAIGGDKYIKYSGIKTPGYERYFHEFEEIFSSTPPLYIYCTRDAHKVWRSWKSIGFLTDISTFEKRYERSLRQAIKIKKCSNNRFILFDLEKYISAKDKTLHLHETVFSKIGLNDASEYKKTFNKQENRNSISNYGSSYHNTPEIEEEMTRLRENKKIIEYKLILES